MIPVLQSTARALGTTGDRGDFPLCDSRSLRLTRYARPDLNDETTPTRKNYLQNVVEAQPDPTASQSFLAWQRTLPGIRQIHAQLEARLLINVSGSVMENAGLNLDRYGITYLPGSAVKGCARRAALAALRQWCTTLTDDKPTKPDGDDLLASACEPFDQPGDLLLAIFQVFGCTDLEWDDWSEEKESGNDLAWACAAQWSTLRDAARTALLSSIGYSESSLRDNVAPSLRGQIAFLPAYPAKLPTKDLELDVLTPHHKKYYEGHADYPVALDTEDPVPIFFPAVAAGTEYTFALLPVGTTPADSPLLDHATNWLLTGLTTFGLGAKTSAGYGWFKDITDTVIGREAKAAAQREAVAEAKALEEKRKAELAARRAREAELASMSPEARADTELAAITTDRGRLKQHLARFAESNPKKTLSDAEKGAILRWFNGGGRDLWLSEIKTGQGKPKDRDVWKRIVGPIHASKKDLKIDLP